MTPEQQAALEAARARLKGGGRTPDQEAALSAARARAATAASLIPTDPNAPAMPNLLRDGVLSGATPDMTSPEAQALTAEIGQRKRESGMSPIRAKALGLAHGGAYGFSDELGAAMVSPFVDETYGEVRDMLRGSNTAAANAQPGAFHSGEILGALLAPGPVYKSTGKLGLDALHGATTGAGLSGLYGFGASEGGFSERAQDALLSGGIGGFIGGLIPVVGAGLKRVAGGLAERAAAKEALRTAPTTDQLRAAGNAAYKAVDDAGVVVKPDAFGNMVGDVTDAMRRGGLDEGMGSLTPQSARAVAIMEDAATSPKNAAGIPFSEIDLLRRKAGVPASNMSVPLESRLGMQAIEGVDDFVNKLTPDQVIAGDAEALPGLITKARETWARMSKSQMIDDAIEASENYLSGSASGIRNQFARILKSEKLSRGFTETEKNAMRRAINGSIPQQLLNLVGGGLGQLGLMGGGATAGGVPGALAGAAVAGGARRGSEALARRNAEIVRALVAAGNTVNVPQIGNQARAIMEALMQRGTAAGLQQ